MSEQSWTVKIWYLGMHDDIVSMEQTKPNESSALHYAEVCVTRYAWWNNEEGRVEMIPGVRVLRVEVYQL